MNRYTFDFEVFPNFACVTFVEIKTGNIQSFQIWKEQDDRKQLFKFLSSNPFLISFNGLSYDLPILRFIRDYKGNNLNTDLFSVSSRLVSDVTRQNEDIKALRYPRHSDYYHMDLMSMMGFLRTGVGLKQCSINLKWHKIQDLPLSYKHIVSKSDVATIIDYNINDCLITLELYNHKLVTQYRELREKLVDDFGMGILSASKSQMANIILESLYSAETGLQKKDFKDLRTPRGSISFKDVIFPNINFKTLEFQNLLTGLKEIVVYPETEYKFKQVVRYKGNTYNLGIGGLHTDEKAAKYGTDSSILTMDVASFYPSIMCEYNVRPEHIDDAFLKILSRVKKERLEAKNSGNKVKAETYKILINSVFGKLGYAGYWLYDPLALIRVTLNGQLFLLMLAERLEMESGIHVISGNTDGLELSLPAYKFPIAKSIAQEWERDTNFELEFDEYTIYVKSDVNNYLAQSVDGKIKEKGSFLTDISLEKGYKHPAVPKAVRNYFINGIPVEETIRNCTDILDFCISQKSGKEFAMELKTVRGTELLQKTNRFYIANTGGALLKRKSSSGSLTGVFAGQNIRILNDYDSTTPFEKYDVDLDWYIREAKSRIEEIEPTVVQLTMFGAEIDYGKKIKMIAPSEKKKRPSPKKIKESDIREANKTRTRYEISQKYFLVTDVNTKWTPVVTLYNFESGNGNLKAKIKKPSFERKPLKVGDVVFAKELSEEPKLEKVGDTFVPVAGQTVWWLKAYALITDFSEFKLKEITE